MVRSEKMFSPIFYPLDRSTQAQRARTYQHVLRVKFATDTKPASDVPLAKFDRPLRQLQHTTDRVTIVMRHLGGAVHRQHAGVAIVYGQRSARLHRHTGMTSNRNL